MEYNDVPIGLFDILGFSQIIKGKEIKHIGEFLETVYANVRENLPGEVFEIDYEIVSDTIVFYSSASKTAQKDINIGFTAVFFMALNLLIEFAVQQIPLRGVITVGDIFRDPNKRVIMSQTIIKCHELEKNQNWAGCIIDKDKEDLIMRGIKGALLDKPGLCVNYDVPLKSGKVEKYCCINWLSKYPNSCYVENVFNGYGMNPKLEHKNWHKVQNTVAFWKWLKENSEDT